eukprot:5668422-Prymnesium_polylepis.1
MRRQTTSRSSQPTSSVELPLRSRADNCASQGWPTWRRGWRCVCQLQPVHIAGSSRRARPAFTPRRPSLKAGGSVVADVNVGSIQPGRCSTSLGEESSSSRRSLRSRVTAWLSIKSSSSH